MAETKEADKAKAAAVKPADVRTVVHKNDEELLKRHDIPPEGVLVVDEDTYGKVARLGHFFDPRTEASNFRPPLQISDLKGEDKENVLTALAEGGKK